MTIATTMTDTDVIYDMFLHQGERRRKRMDSYYVCKYCDNQFLFGVPKKERYCPVCMNLMHLVSIVDEFEAGRIAEWSGGTVLHKKDLTEKNIRLLRVAFYMRPGVGQQVKTKVSDSLRKELC